MRYIHFYALGDDIERVFREVENHLDLTYTLTGNFTTPKIESYRSGLDIAGLGVAASPSSIANPTFLVSLREHGVKVREMGTSGQDRLLVDQLANPDTVLVTPAGLWGAEILIQGRVATVSDGAVAQRLMRAFGRPIARDFTKVRMSWLGPAAHAFWKAGHRLTAAVQSPAASDLRPL